MLFITSRSAWVDRMVIFCFSSIICWPSSLFSSPSCIFICLRAMRAPRWSPAFFFAKALAYASLMRVSDTLILLLMISHWASSLSIVAVGSAGAGFAGAAWVFPPAPPNSFLNILLILLLSKLLNYLSRDLDCFSFWFFIIDWNKAELLYDL